MIEQKYEPWDLKAFYPSNHKIPKSLIPPKYIRNNQRVDIDKFKDYFIKPNEQYRPKTANKSSQKRRAESQFAPIDEQYFTMDGKVGELRNFGFTLLERKQTSSIKNLASTQTNSNTKSRPKTSKHRSSWWQLLIDKNVKL